MFEPLVRVLIETVSFIRTELNHSGIDESLKTGFRSEAASLKNVVASKKSWSLGTDLSVEQV